MSWNVLNLHAILLYIKRVRFWRKKRSRTWLKIASHLIIYHVQTFQLLLNSKICSKLSKIILSLFAASKTIMAAKASLPVRIRPISGRFGIIESLQWCFHLLKNLFIFFLFKNIYRLFLAHFRSVTCQLPVLFYLSLFRLSWIVLNQNSKYWCKINLYILSERPLLTCLLLRWFNIV